MQQPAQTKLGHRRRVPFELILSVDLSAMPSEISAAWSESSRQETCSVSSQTPESCGFSRRIIIEKKSWHRKAFLF